MNKYHIPVLLNEAICSLNIIPGEKYIDATLGGGGHTEEILLHQGQVLAIDADIEAIDHAKKRLAPFLNTACSAMYPTVHGSHQKPNAFLQNNQKQLTLIHGNFSQIEKICQEHKFFPVKGILYDLGVSSHQLETPNRGFSFNTNAILDMRMDQRLTVKASDLINGLTEKELYELFEKFGEEHHSWAIAHALVRARQIRKIETCDELAKIILSVRYQKGKYDRTHPATRIFQALRIVVNDELNSLKESLSEALDILDKEGRLVVISFHSLEDRIVKNFIKEENFKKKLKILTKHPIKPTLEEININPRSRSAKLRIAEKI